MEKKQGKRGKKGVEEGDRTERAASGGMLPSTDPGFAGAVHSGEEPTEPAAGATTQRAIEQEGSTEQRVDLRGEEKRERRGI